LEQVLKFGQVVEAHGFEAFGEEFPCVGGFGAREEQGALADEMAFIAAGHR